MKLNAFPSYYLCFYFVLFSVITELSDYSVTFKRSIEGENAALYCDYCFHQVIVFKVSLYLN